MKTVVGVSDYRVSTNVNEIIVTYALGSCLGITVYDTVACVGGLLHVMLPDSKADIEKAEKEPTMYVDTGLTLFLEELYQMGAQKRNLKITVAGGATMKMNGKDDYFKIGKRNLTAFKKYLWEKGLMITNQAVGGSISRTMALRIADGAVSINNKPIGKLSGNPNPNSRSERFN